MLGDPCFSGFSCFLGRFGEFVTVSGRGVGWVWLSSEPLAEYLTKSLNSLIKIGAPVSLVSARIFNIGARSGLWQ